MRRGAKRAKAKGESKRPVARKSGKGEGSRVRDLEKRLAEALKREAEGRGAADGDRRNPERHLPVHRPTSSRSSRPSFGAHRACAAQPMSRCTESKVPSCARWLEEGPAARARPSMSTRPAPSPARPSAVAPSSSGRRSTYPTIRPRKRLASIRTPDATQVSGPRSAFLCSGTGSRSAPSLRTGPNPDRLLSMRSLSSGPSPIRRRSPSRTCGCSPNCRGFISAAPPAARRGPWPACAMC